MPGRSWPRSMMIWRRGTTTDSISTEKSASVQRSAFPAHTTLALHQRKARIGPRPRRRDRRSATRAVSAELYVEWLRAQRPIKPGEPHAVLASAGDGQADHRRVLTTAPRAISGYRWHSARHSRLSAAPRPHRVRRLLARRCGDAAGRVRRHDLGPHRPMIVLGPALILSADPACEPIPD